MEKELAFPQFVPLHIGYADHYANWNFENIHSPFLRIYLSVSGDAQVLMQGKRYQLQPNHLYLIPPFTMHTDYSKGSFTHYYVHAFEEMVDRKFSVFERFHFPFEVEASSEDLGLMKRLVDINRGRELLNCDPRDYDNAKVLMEMISRNGVSDYSNFIETRGILLQLFSRFLVKSELIATAIDSRIIQSMSYIRDHIEQTISVSKLAKAVCLDKDHFIRLFKRETSVTPLSYIQQKKIEQAQILFIHKNMSVDEVAYTLGYANASYFIRLFKKAVGKTPMEYKRENLNAYRSTIKQV